jgi:diguanylate cyclase (GGDEF)-like protein
MQPVCVSDNTIAEGPTRPVKRLIVPIVIVVFCLSALSAAVLINARSAEWERAGDVASRMAAAVASDMSRNFETLDLSLQAVVDDLKRPDIDQFSPEHRNLILFDRSATARHLGTIMVTDEAGNVRLDSRTLTPKPVNLADRDYFQVQKNNGAIGMYISRPFITRTSNELVIGVSRRLSHADGSFAGVVVGTLRLSSLRQLFKDIALGPGSNVTLSRTDGAVLMRWPYRADYIGLNLKTAELYKHLAVSRAGKFETDAATDGVHRLIYYTQIDDLPLVVGVGQATSVIYASWNKYAIIMTLMIIAFCMTGITLAYELFRELNRRSEAEAKLLVLASTDPLTGLSNRRQFDEALDREWRRAARYETSIALLMIDIDLFKPYNDQRGHQSGDMLLQSLGSAINDALKRGGDIGARYGGDEFAILLPETSSDGVTRVTESIREEFARLCSELGIHQPGLSMGISCAIPRAGDLPAMLIKAADEALYRAKQLGRNRTEVAADEPRLIGSTISRGPSLAA